ncbi:uncharacterized protein LOC107863781 isoform X3 [Capsicum annuum]|uniref:uncharacterized protein LOC107863781 isoform X3 n=1 Tax=Capsicum annuum TaxID=4072 RepID=UPI0007BEA987|nr:uncharacterized protein LOC107863781 isoform X3 [Capsicum annuum]
MYSQESSDKNILFKPNMALVISTLNGASHANRVHDFQLQVKWRHHGARRPLCVQLLSGVQQLAPWIKDGLTRSPSNSGYFTPSYLMDSLHRRE